MSVLNFVLYKQLMRLFKHVEIKYPGQDASGFYTTDPLSGNKQFQYVSWGERYVVNCCFCNDRRGRMAVGHRYGVVDNVIGKPSYSLWKCFNEECQTEESHRDYLRRNLLNTYSKSKFQIDNVRIPDVKLCSSDTLPVVEFPGTLTLLKNLPPNHKAVTYLADRHFDCTELSDVWGVGYGDNVPARCKGAFSQDRIIIPVTLNRELVGWQARHIGSVSKQDQKNGLRKYLTYFPSSQVLYGQDLITADADPVVVVEGATDVWRYGPNAVARFGKTLSARHVQILNEYCKKAGGSKPLAIIPDGDDPTALDSSLKDVQSLEMSGYGGRIEVVPIKNYDPADLSKATLHRLIQKIFCS